MKYRISTNTIAKVAPVQSTFLKPQYCKPLSKGTIVELRNTEKVFNHLQLTTGYWVWEAHLEKNDNLISRAAKFIAQFEGFRANAYQLPGEIFYTIGYGTTRYSSGEVVRSADVITEQVALKELETRIQSDYVMLSGNVDLSKLTEDQIIALLSFIYNVGVNAFLNSTLYKRLQEGKLDEVPNELKRWVKGSDGKVLNGLIARRKAESELWNA